MIGFWAFFRVMEEWVNKYGKIILPLLAAIVAVMLAYGATMRDDVKALQREDEVLKDGIARVEKSNKEDRILFKQSVDKIDTKIDGINIKIDLKFDKLNDDILRIWQDPPKKNR